MIILMTYSITKVLLGILSVSLAILIIAIAYKKLLAHLGKGTPASKDYCVLYALEQNPVVKELEIYFTTVFPKHVSIEILNDDMSLMKVIAANDYEVGGHIVRYDSTLIPNGNYYYCLRTENQKTMKKMIVENA